MAETYDSDGFILDPSPNVGLHKLHAAVVNDDVKVTHELLEQGIDPNIVTRSQCRDTCLHIAVEQLCTESESGDEVEKWSVGSELIKLLLEHKASVTLTNAFCAQPLSYLPTFFIGQPNFIDACTERVLPVLDLLLERKAAIDHKDQNNETLLSRCCSSMNLTLVEELLDRGANPRDEDILSGLDEINRNLRSRLCRLNILNILNVLEKHGKLTETEW